MVKMKKIILILVLALFLLPVSLAGVPSNNRMKLGTISNVLPVEDMRSYYTEMEPVMLKYFGPPFSDFTLTIEANPAGDEHATGFLPEKQTLVLAGQARDYVKYKETDPGHAVELIRGSMRHELSHGMYMYGNNIVGFGVQWPWEGWAKVLEEEITASEVEGRVAPLGWFYNYYLDKDIVAGTEGWGGSKQPYNHAAVYSMTGATHYMLLAAASKSDLDFYKTMNNALYDYIKSKGNPHLSIEEYKSLMKGLLAGVKIDGQPAVDWYFDNPSAFTQGSLGPHVNAFTENSERNFEPTQIRAYAFNRQMENERRKEKNLAGVNIVVKIKDSDKDTVFEKTLTTGEDGVTQDVIQTFNDLERGSYMLTAEASIEGKNVKSKIFTINSPRIDTEKEYVYGVLLDKDKEIINGKYVSLLTADADFIYKKNGLFILKVPVEKKIVTLNFLGLTQEVTKGSFARIFAFTIPDSYIQKASLKTEEDLEKGIVEVEEDEKFMIPPGSEQKIITQGCGDGICDSYEKESNGCPEDCQPGRVEKTEKVEKEEMVPKGEKVPKEFGMRPKGFFTKVLDWFLDLLGLERKSERMEMMEREEGAFGGREGMERPEQREEMMERPEQEIEPMRGPEQRTDLIYEKCTPNEIICREGWELGCSPGGTTLKKLKECPERCKDEKSCA